MCWWSLSGQFECQQDCSRVSLSLKEGFLSRIVISWRLEPPGKMATKMSQDGVIVRHSSSTLYMMSYITFLQALRHNFCNRREWKQNRPFTTIGGYYWTPYIICVMKWMRKEKIVDAGWSVQFVIGGIIWTAVDLWSVHTPPLKSLIFIYMLRS